MKLIKGMEKMMVQEPASSENNILFCDECGCDDFNSVVVDSVESIVCETDIYCDECGNKVNEWSYGFYRNEKSEKYFLEEKRRERNKKIGNLI